MSEPTPFIITSASNRRVVEARKLRLRKHRQATARFLVEGLQLLYMALDARLRPYEVFYCPELLAAPAAETLLTRLQQAGGQPWQVTPAVMASLSERDSPQGIVAVFELTQVTLDQFQARTDGLILVLDRLQDPGNLGTLMRTADAVGASGVILIEPCVDPFDPKTLRGSMGSLFNIPLISTRAVPALFAWLRGQGLRPVGADPHTGVLWGEGIWRGGVALVLGNEARGLSPDVAAEVHQHVRLPIMGKAESLNVAIAGGVLMYAWLRENLR